MLQLLLCLFKLLCEIEIVSLEFFVVVSDSFHLFIVFLKLMVSFVPFALVSTHDSLYLMPVAQLEVSSHLSVLNFHAFDQG